MSELENIHSFVSIKPAEQANVQLILPKKPWREKSAVFLEVHFLLTDTLARTFPHSTTAFPGLCSTTMSSTRLCSSYFPTLSAAPSEVTTVAPPHHVSGIRRHIPKAPMPAQKHVLDPAQSPLLKPPFCNPPEVSRLVRDFPPA